LRGEGWEWGRGRGSEYRRPAWSDPKLRAKETSHEEGERGKSRRAELMRIKSINEREWLFCQVMEPSGTVRKKE
jgi:hypothetical protein